MLSLITFCDCFLYACMCVEGVVYVSYLWIILYHFCLYFPSSFYPLHCCCSVTQLCLTFCYTMACRTPSFPVLHHLSELPQTHVHWVGDPIQPFHPLPSPSPAFNLFSIRVFSNESALRIRWPKCWSFSFSPSNEYSGLISFTLTHGFLSFILKCS